MTEETQQFICQNTFSAMTCDISESYALGLLFYLFFIFTCGFLGFHFIFSKTKKIFTSPVVFYLIMGTYLLYRGTVTIFYFDWTINLYNLIFIAFNAFFIFIYNSLVILILFNLLFKYQRQEQQVISFVNFLFFSTVFAFLILGIIFYFTDYLAQNFNDPDKSLSLWLACTDLILVVFFVFPANLVLKEYTSPMLNKEDVHCVRFCKCGIIIYCSIYGLRFLFHLTHYFNINPLYNGIIQDRKNSDFLTTRSRAIAFLFYFISELIPAGLSSITIFLFDKNDLLYDDNPYGESLQ